uniref:Uncharacterized protein n=1 Tax=Rhinolophus ferrumequinum TaxID=59479 RepID=A0A671E391_RHIFE
MVRKSVLLRFSHPSRKVPYQKFHKKVCSHETRSQTANHFDKFRSFNQKAFKSLSHMTPQIPLRATQHHSTVPINTWTFPCES